MFSHHKQLDTIFHMSGLMCQVTHISAKCILKLVNRTGDRYGGGARRQAEVRVFGAHTELNGRDGKYAVHMEIHTVDWSNWATF